MTQTAIVWFRRDLRLTDNPALTAASSYARVIPVYIHAPDEEQPWAPGGAQRVWLHETLHALAGQLDAHGSQLVVRRGPSLETLRALVAATGATAVFWNRLYEPAIIERDKHVKQTLLDDDCEVASHNAALLCEPWRIATGSGTPYKVFTPFGRALFQRPMAAPDALPDALPPAPPGIDSLTVDDLALRPRINWDTDIRRTWTPGENGAHARLESFLGESISDYKEQRDRPAMPATSRLSPHLHFGEIGPRQVWHRVHEWLDGMRSRGPDTFLNELAWREFAHHLLYHFPQTPEEALDTRFGDFPRKDDPKVLRA